MQWGKPFTDAGAKLIPLLKTQVWVPATADSLITDIVALDGIEPSQLEAARKRYIGKPYSAVLSN